MNKIGQKEMAKLKKDPESVGHEIKKAAEYIGHEIKENTELAEHETGVQNVKKSTKSVFNKMKDYKNRS
ncbi:MAG: hypothetical protein WBL68_04605 [Nitrososphaeraceae archaeon]